jgi:hypothetical protein
LLRVRTGADLWEPSHTGHFSPRQHISQNNHS